MPRRSSLVEHELGRRQLHLQAEDRPLVVVQIELRHHMGQVEVGLPVGVEGADVAPVGPVADHVDAAVGETVRHQAPPLRDQARDQVLAEVVAGARVAGIAFQFRSQKVGIEDVDAHADQRAVLDARAGLGVGGLLLEGSTMRPWASVAITPKFTASASGASMQATVTSAPLAACSASITA
jgi:hypothetical protein